MDRMGGGRGWLAVSEVKVRSEKLRNTTGIVENCPARLTRLSSPQNLEVSPLKTKLLFALIKNKL